MTAPTRLGDALRDFAGVCDLHPDWSTFGCLFSLDGLRLHFHVTRDGLPVDVARALLAAALAHDLEDVADRHAEAQPWTP